MVGTHEKERKQCMEEQGIFIERILSNENMNRAYKQVKKNKGAAGIDGMECADLLSHLKVNGQQLRESIRNQSYKPMPVKRVEIPKADGSKRKLGIPTVTDRMVQQAAAQVLTPIYERKILSLIRKFLVSGVMVGEQIEETEIGTPQGGNISPLLANILLNELDWELESRGLKFVRYADDCIIFVKSGKAAARVMESVTKYIENVLRLKVNRGKSKIGRPTEIQYLGFAFYYQFQEKKYKIKVPQKSLDKVMKKVRKLTSRKWGVSNSYKAQKIAEVVRGWINYFKIGSILTATRRLDTVIRYRFRMCIWKHWKNPKTRYRNLIKLGVSKKNAKSAAGFHGYARVCRTETICYAMSNARLKKFGLLSAEEYFCQTRC